MLTIFGLLEGKTRMWIKEERGNNQSAVGNLLRYIEKQGKLREPQLKSIEIYLWIKFAGQNQKLADIIRQGFLFDHRDIEEFELHLFGSNFTAQFLNRFAMDNNLKNLREALKKDWNGKINDWDDVLARLLHDFDYPNYLFSLPMEIGRAHV